MDGLRGLLLLFGLLVIAGVYLYSRRQKKPKEEPEAPRVRVEPRLDGASPDQEAVELDSDSESELESETVETSLPSGGPQKIVTVRIVAREKKSFPGDELILSMRGIGLRHGKFGIFHRYDGDVFGGHRYSTNYRRRTAF